MFLVSKEVGDASSRDSGAQQVVTNLRSTTHPQTKTYEAPVDQPRLTEVEHDASY